MADGFWCFQCPVCGFGHDEFGRLAEDQEFVCEICLEDGHGEIRLERWLPQAPSLAYARFRSDLAA